jgi:5-methylcytosine-specific restriction endonuclease McrA
MAIRPEIAERVRSKAQHRCGYCLTPQSLIPSPLEIEHIIPQSRGGSNDEQNLWLACRLCNLYKSDKTHGRDPQTNHRVRLFNPRTQIWSQHFRWSKDGTEIIGRTVCGRATVGELNLNNPLAVNVRQNWASVGWFPP